MKTLMGPPVVGQEKMNVGGKSPVLSLLPYGSGPGSFDEGTVVTAIKDHETGPPKEALKQELEKEKQSGQQQKKKKVKWEKLILEEVG